ncbi:hypothetical protein [Acetivibrio cellulolyticus]|nr:hypothetical protein [Acetivibrio cellulolyticus]
MLKKKIKVIDKDRQQYYFNNSELDDYDFGGSTENTSELDDYDFYKN